MDFPGFLILMFLLLGVPVSAQKVSDYSAIQELTRNMDFIFVKPGTKNCVKKTSCNPLLNQIEADNRSDKLWGKDYSWTCEGRELNVKNDETTYGLELMLRRDSRDLIGENNFLPMHCRSSSENDLASRKKLSLHYYAMTRFAETQNQAMQQLGLTQKLLGLDTLDSQNCDQFSFPKTIQSCHELKKSCMNLNPGTQEKQLEEMASRTEEVMKKRQKIRSEKNEIRSQVNAKALNAEQKKSREALLSEKEKELVQIEAQAPWITGENFKHALIQRKSYKLAIQEQLKANIASFKQYLQETEWAAECFKGIEKNCDIEKIRNVLANSIDAKTSGKNSSQQYYAYHKCVQEARIDYQQMNQVVKDTFNDAGIMAISLFTAGGSLAALSERALLRTIGTSARTGMLATDLGANVANSYSQYLNARETCQEMTGLDQMPEQPSNKCEIESLQSSSSAVKDYTLCLKQASLFFVANASFSVSAFKSSLREVDDVAKTLKTEKSTLQFVEDHNHNHRRRFGDFTGNDSRKLASARLHGYHGKIVEENTRIKPLPFLEAQDIQVAKIKSPDGIETLHFREVVQLPDGTWKNRWPEIKIDPATGFLDANFPGGKKLFQTIAEKSREKGYLAFIDLGNLGAINKFSDGKEAGDQFLSEVSKIILEKSQGKVSAARLGGDEIGLVIHEADPAKAKAYLEDIVQTIRNKKSDVRKIFDDEKATLIAQARTQDLSGLSKEQKREKLADVVNFGKIQMPDLSIGLSKLSFGSTFQADLAAAESLATEMKIPNKLSVGMSAEKYGSYQAPRATNPKNQKYDVKIASKEVADFAGGPTLSSRTGLPDIELIPEKELRRFGDTALMEYKDETGAISYRVEKWVLNFEEGKKIKTSVEIPTRGADGLIDGMHPESQKLAVGNLLKSQEPDRALTMIKLRSLRYLNYFSSGTNAGDQMMSVLTQELKQEFKRDSDLKMQLGGADFLVSADHIKPEQMRAIEKRLQEAVKNNPLAQKLLADEKKSLEIKLQNLKKKQEAETSPNQKAEIERESRTIQERLKSVLDFDFQIQLRSLSPEQVDPSGGFPEFRKQLEDQFSMK